MFLRVQQNRRDAKAALDAADAHHHILYVLSCSSFCKSKFDARAAPAALAAPDGFAAPVALAAHATFAELMHAMYAMQLTVI